MTSPLTPTERDAWRAVLVLADQLRFRVATEIRPQTNLTSAEHSVLMHMYEAPNQRLGQQELANIMFWSKSRLSHQLTRMQARGLIRRSAPNGRLGVQLSLTEAGVAAVRAAVDVHAAAVRRHLLDLAEPHEIEMLTRLAQRLVTGTDGQGPTALDE